MRRFGQGRLPPGPESTTRAGRLVGKRKVREKERKDKGTLLRLKLQNSASAWIDPLKNDGAHLRTIVEHTDEEVFFKDRNHVFIAASPSFRGAVAHLLPNVAAEG